MKVLYKYKRETPVMLENATMKNLSNTQQVKTNSLFAFKLTHTFAFCMLFIILQHYASFTIYFSSQTIRKQLN